MTKCPTMDVSVTALTLVICSLFLMALFASRSRAQEQRSSYRDALAAFHDPPAGYRSAPLWVWNDRVTRRQIDEQLKDFKTHGIGGVFIHPRPGLVTPYLSDEWFDLWRYAVSVGKKLGMKIWIYDENSYPSGFAGGHVPAAMPDAARSGLKMVHATRLPARFDVDPLVILSKQGDAYVDITAEAKTKASGPGEYCIFSVVKQRPNPWHGGFTYVDIMRRDVTEKFIDITMNAYKRAVGAEFGSVVPGVFQDEAEISPASEPGAVVVNYTPALFERFRAKWGYDLRPHLPSLFEQTGNWRTVRHNFYATLLTLFLENWAKPYYDYCSKNNLRFTGHYWEHEWPRPVINPDNMAFAAYAHMPGVDILMNRFAMDTHAQFGNARAVKEIRSAANQLGKERTMSETFGAGGWDMTFADQKRIADWEFALGVNFVNQHLSYVTIKGARKRDHPLSFSYHEPWWGDYAVLGDYFARLSVALTSGEQINPILVIEPTTTAWMAYAPSDTSDLLRIIGKRFQNFVNLLEASQIEYDLASENIIREHGQTSGGRLIVGRRRYDCVVLPPSIENLDKSTLTMLERYMDGGGKIVCYGDPPRYIHGTPSPGAATLAAKYGAHWITAGSDSDCSAIRKISPSQVEFSLSPGDPVAPGLLFHHRRSLKDCELLFLANTDPDKAASGTITAPGNSCERWDPFTGEVKSTEYAVERGRLSSRFSIPPGGSLLLCLRAGAGTPTRAGQRHWTEVASGTPVAARRLDPNVLTIDYCDLTLNEKTDRDLYFYEAQKKTFAAHGLERNPWDNGVQYKTEILDRDRFAPGSGFEASFRFNIENGTDIQSIQAVVERPDLFRVAVNGNQVAPLKDRWWLDESFGVYGIGPYLRRGVNAIVVRSSPFTIQTELEPVYLLGNFSVQPGASGFSIAASRDLVPGPWNRGGMPFYAGRVAYTRTFAFAADQLKGNRFSVKLGAWKGVCAEVFVNGTKAGLIAFAPYDFDVTQWLKSGKNEVTVVVIGSLKNTLGPHHNNPAPGAAWPGQFQQGAKQSPPAGSEYSVFEYGLFDTFALMRSAAGD